MARDKKRSKKVYNCLEPPCIHVVVDERKGIFKVFVEDYDLIIPIPIEEISRACRSLEEELGHASREAYGDEVDYLARKYLDARPKEG
ncbi:MAG: hypothetical protein F7C08_03750 [Desulfurococcales archaeon]|nr:hypothetical protein [Desulfurococcales archaeon]MCE4605628.1 hypothetical protein [Desulfurococcales archaeon]